MRLRPNEFCPIHKSLSGCGRQTLTRPRLVSWEFSAWKTPTIRADTGNYARLAKCGN